MSETECAARIRQYWQERGSNVNVRLETVRNLGLVGTYVRSDMLNGLPRGYKAGQITTTLGEAAMRAAAE